MKPPDEVRRELVRQWLAKADADYATAKLLLNSAEAVREIIAFHCQQAAEKYIKALLVRYGREFPKTHNIRELLNLLSSVLPDVAAGLQTAAILTPYGVETRYPSDSPEVMPGMEAPLFEEAARVRDAVLPFLQSFTGTASP